MATKTEVKTITNKEDLMYEINNLGREIKAVYDSFKKPSIGKKIEEYNNIETAKKHNGPK